MAADWQQIQPLLERALELDAEERRAFLEEARAGDEALLERAEAGFGAADMARHAACARRRLGQVIGGDEGRGKRSLDLGSMADHLASKYEWITSLSDGDHVARVRVRDLQTIPGRLDEVISEIAMGRSIVEG